MSNPHSMSGAAAASDIAGERLTECIHYTLTGDTETDLVTGLVAVINKFYGNRIASPGFNERSVLRVMDYLTRRIQSDLRHIEKMEAIKQEQERQRQRQQEFMRRLQGQQAIEGPPQTWPADSTPSPLNVPFDPLMATPPYTTTSGISSAKIGDLKSKPVKSRAPEEGPF